MKAYKGFNRDMTCRGFKYEEGKEYEHKGEVEACASGFHACEAPLDCFDYYSPCDSVFHEVELGGKTSKNGGDTKVAASRIKIGARLDIAGICKAHFEYVKSRCTNENNAEEGKPATAGSYGAATAGYKGAATAGSYGAATAGFYGAATAGFYGAATAGSYGAATAGSYGAATAGDKGAATAGSYGAATAGYKGAATAGSYGAATAGDKGAATAGDKGAATSRGQSSSGENGLSVARGNDVRVKGGLGAILVIAEENEEDYGIREWKAAVVDGGLIKADTWYRLEKGEFVECDKEVE